MAYTRKDYPSKAAVKRALAAGETVTVFQPGPFGPDLPDGTHTFEGPHYPKPHKWYGRGKVRAGVLLSLT